jgi:MerR family redox-sensitive transcriptional activator SoxR
MTSRPPARPALLSVREVVARTGVAASALRFYEERGLIHSTRTASGHRRYWRATLRRVAFVLFAQRLGLTLEEIRSALDRFSPGRAPTRQDWARLSALWHERIDTQLEELQRLKRGVTTCIGCGCLSLKRCHVLNPADRAATLGPGPRYWLGDAPRGGRSSR